MRTTLMKTLTVTAVITLSTLFSPTTVSAQTVTFEGLLEEMTNRETLARQPSPYYNLGQASSYDRASMKEGEDGWFANADHSNYIRTEEKDGRTERVMMDQKGPGVLTRMWFTRREGGGVLRFYIDGADEPFLVTSPDKLGGGKGIVEPPLAEETARGWNCFLPIPYAKSIKVTYEGPDFNETKDGAHRFYYQINYRTYRPGTKVETFSMKVLDDTQPALNEAIRLLKNPLDALASGTTLLHPIGNAADSQLTPFKSIRRYIAGERAIRRLVLRLEAEDMRQALRSTVLKIAFDGRETVWTPLGEFFGTGVTLTPYQDFYRRVDESGYMLADWVMPFREHCEIVVQNLGEKDVDVIIETIGHTRWNWDSRSMYFHAGWKHEYPVTTEKVFDWNFVKAQGPGLLVGDTLTLRNPSERWWGEGDEKIYIDNEVFPSHFGTGTEDYYGYAWGTAATFATPFHSQPVAEGPGNSGYITNSRVRALDAIPFRKSLRFDMEIFHHVQNKETKLSYSTTTFWYAGPTSEWNIHPNPIEAKRELSEFEM